MTYTRYWVIDDGKKLYFDSYQEALVYADRASYGGDIKRVRVCKDRAIRDMQSRVYRTKQRISQIMAD